MPLSLHPTLRGATGFAFLELPAETTGLFFEPIKTPQPRQVVARLKVISHDHALTGSGLPRACRRGGIFHAEAGHVRRIWLFCRAIVSGGGTAATVTWKQRE